MTRRVIHYNGGDYRPGPGLMDILVYIWIGIFVIYAIVSLVILVLGIAAAVAVVGGLGYLSYRLKKHAILLTKGKAKLAIATRRVIGVLKKKERVQQKTKDLSNTDQQQALAPIDAALDNAVSSFEKEKAALLAVIADIIQDLAECRIKVLEKADRRSSKRLKKILTRIDEGTNRSKELSNNLKRREPPEDWVAEPEN